MNTPLVPKIAKLCPANWAEMKGDEKRRFCEHCQLHVHNLSAMTLREQKQVLTTQAERVCIGYVMPSQEVKVVAPERWLAHQTRQTSWRRLAAVFAALWALTGVSCQTASPAQHSCSPPETPPASASKSDGYKVGGKVVAGGIMPTRRPFWKRLFGLY